jgi:hypothetical protein
MCHSSSYGAVLRMNESGPNLRDFFTEPIDVAPNPFDCSTIVDDSQNNFPSGVPQRFRLAPNEGVDLY